MSVKIPRLCSVSAKRGPDARELWLLRVRVHGPAFVGSVLLEQVVPLRVPASSESPVADAVRAKLTAAGKLDSYRGQVAVFLAGRMERSRVENAVSLLSRELDRLMSEVLADVADEPDELDALQGQVIEMRTRRRRPAR